MFSSVDSEDPTRSPSLIRFTSFKISVGDLGGDGQRLEERGLLGPQCGGLGGDLDIQGGQGSSTGRGLHFVVKKHLSDFREIFLGEDEAYIVLDDRKKLFQSWIAVQMTTDSFPHHSVLAHEDNGLSPESSTNLLHLLGTDIVCIDNECFWVLIK